MNEQRVDDLTFLYLRRCGWVTGGNSACRAPGFHTTLVRLERLTRWLETEYRVSLPRVPLADVKAVKKFCDDIFDRQSRHEWRSSLRGSHACLRVRSSVCATLFLFRKVVPVKRLSPSDLEEITEKYITKMSTPSPPPSPEFLRFAEDLVRSEFRPGWDRGWYSASDAFCLPVKSCLENRSGGGGARGYIHSPSMGWRWRHGVEMPALQADYLDFVEPDETSTSQVKLSPDTRIMTIRTGGKNRTVSMFSAKRSFLKPLHQIMYGYLSGKEWLLRGEATAERFSDYSQVEGEVLVSGDYESATDNLQLPVSLCLLRAMRRQSRHVPTGVWDAAEASLVNRFEDGRWQRRGQLMGSLLSFPLLCLTNYVGFKWSVAREVPVRVNGDDIVFRSTFKEAQSWEQGVRDAGLTLSKGKTLITRTLFSLNSNFFLSRRGRVEQVPHIRSSCVWEKPDVATAVPGKIERAVIGMPGVSRSVHTEVLRTCHSMILDSQRSVTRGLQCPVSVSCVRAAGLAEREAFYLSLPVEPSVPPPFKRWQEWRVPGWRCVVVDSGKGDDTGFLPALVRSTWEVPIVKSDISHDAYRRELREGTFRFVPLSKKYFRMLGGAKHTWGDFCRLLPHDWERKVFRRRNGGERVWRRAGGGDIAFAPAGVE